MRSDKYFSFLNANNLGIEGLHISMSRSATWNLVESVNAKFEEIVLFLDNINII